MFDSQWYKQKLFDSQWYQKYRLEYDYDDSHISDETYKIFAQVVNQTVELLDKYDIYTSSIRFEFYKRLYLNILETEGNSRKINYYCSCWGGEIWDQLYHYYDDKYKHKLVDNHYERENNPRLSPEYASFPHDDLNTICAQLHGFNINSFAFMIELLEQE